jgi:hypothetical protein
LQLPDRLGVVAGHAGRQASTAGAGLGLDPSELREQDNGAVAEKRSAEQALATTQNDVGGRNSSHTSIGWET